MGRAKEQLPSKPFADWLGERLAFYASRYDGNLGSATAALTRECGWGNHNDGARKLYRFRKQMRSTSFGNSSKKGDVVSDWCPRGPVEDALHSAGMLIGDLYPYEALIDEMQMEFEVPRDQARRLADAWIESTWQGVWERAGRYVVPAERPRAYCLGCRRTERVFAGVCEACMTPVTVLRAVS